MGQCECGCGQEVLNRFVSGHNLRVLDRSEESNRKRSETLKKKYASGEIVSYFKEGGEPWNKDMKMSPEFCKKVSDGCQGPKPWLRGRPVSDEDRLNIATKLMKDQTGNGGYCDIWMDREYKRDIRKDHCERCGASKEDANLVNHHMDFDKMNCGPDNIQTLCRRCHTTIHWEHRRSA